MRAERSVGEKNDCSWLDVYVAGAWYLLVNFERTIPTWIVIAESKMNLDLILAVVLAVGVLSPSLISLAITIRQY